MKEIGWNMRKGFWRFWILCVTAVFLLCGRVAAADISVLYNGKTLEFSEGAGTPYIENDRVLIPLRAVAQGMGKQVEWQSDTARVTILDGETEVRLTIGSKIAAVNDTWVTTDVPATIRNGRTYVPLRFVSQCLGAEVEWDGTLRQVRITEETKAGGLTEGVLRTSAVSQLRYLLYTPENPKENMPLILYLHGGSGKGDDLSLLLSAESLPKFLQEGETAVDAYVVMPQLPADKKGWAEIAAAPEELIAEMETKYGVDADRVSLTGHSMGGTGVWSMVLKKPELFSAAAPLSGSVRLTGGQDLQAISDLPIWAFAGTEDTIVPPASSVQAVERLQQKNAAAKITLLEGDTHFDVPTSVYLDEKTDLLGWLIRQVRK